MGFGLEQDKNKGKKKKTGEQTSQKEFSQNERLWWDKNGFSPHNIVGGRHSLQGTEEEGCREVDDWKGCWRGFSGRTGEESTSGPSACQGCEVKWNTILIPISQSAFHDIGGLDV
jgi:hypothetical protein